MDKKQQETLRTYIRNTLPIVLLGLGWFNVLSLSNNLEKNVIETYQDAQLEVVRNAKRASELYIESELERRGIQEVDQIEREVQRKFVQPIRVGEVGDAWIYAPDHIVFDQSEDLPELYWGKSMAEIFEIQKEHGARHYEEMTEAVTNGQEGVGWYMFWPDKSKDHTRWWEFVTRDAGREIAAWTSVKVFEGSDREMLWVIGMSVMLPEIMENAGAYAQIQTAIIQMAIVTVLVSGLMYFLYRAEAQTKKLRHQVHVLQIQIDEVRKKAEVAKIVESVSCQELVARAKEMRALRQQRDRERTGSA